MTIILILQEQGNAKANEFIKMIGAKFIYFRQQWMKETKKRELKTRISKIDKNTGKDS